MIKALAIALLTLTIFPRAARSEDSVGSAQRAVLVTGASTGIGRKITERLAAHAYIVYAGARKESDLLALNAIPGVHAVRLDVTKPEEINAVLETISHERHGLYGLVNNAGIASTGPLIEMSPEEFNLTMQVNLYGPYRMTRAFARLLMSAKGRIVNIGSIRGILSDTELGAYQMSKHAIESFSDVLAQELAASGVNVSLVDPGSYHSNIELNEASRTGQSLEGTDRSQYKEPDEVAAAVELALSARMPRRRYMVVPNQGQAALTVNALLDQLVQLNGGQPYAYNRAQLVTLLDQALARERRSQH
jgi:NAD(P)-dependent dehydrogenase (short-subunit alcohol dehydrogenase family)